MIVFGTTVAQDHSHGRVRPNRLEATAISDPGSAPASDSSSHQTECSICQFHQQLFKGLVHTSLLGPTTAAQFSTACEPLLRYSSVSTTAQRGRAPPLTSLL
jgi:hypothetical protein